MSEERLISEPRPIVERVLYQGDDEPRYGPTLATLVGDGHGLAKPADFTAALRAAAIPA